MMMTARTVCVTVLNFFSRRIANFSDLDVEVEILAREWVVTVDGDVRVSDAGNDDDLNLTMARVSVELIADLNVFFRDLRARNLNDRFRIVFAVCISCFYRNRLLIAFFEAVEGALEARNDLTDAFEVAQRLIVMGRLENRSFGILQSVVEANNFWRHMRILESGVFAARTFATVRRFL